MERGGALARAGRWLYSWPAVVALAAVIVVGLWLRWLGQQRAPSAVESVLSVAVVLLLAASTATIRRERARERRMAAGTVGDLLTRQAMFREEVRGRLEAQRKLRESDARIGAIIASAPIVLFAIERDDVISFSAGTGPDPLGKASGEAIGWSAAELFRNHPGVVAAIRRALSGSGAETEMTENDRSFAISLAPFREAEGQIAGAIGIAIEITERRRAEQELQRNVETLQRVDRERQALLSRLVSAQEEERRRIARDMHDDSIQSMFAVGLRLELLRSTIKDSHQLEALDQLRQTVESTTHRLRHLLFELRPAVLDEAGLGEALREYLDVMRTETGVDVRLESELDPGPGSKAQVIAYRIAQEALINVRKHAHARHVECHVSSIDGGILVKIADDGAGMPVGGAQPAAGHLGLAAMRERAELAGGWLRLTSSAGQGTVVEFWVAELAEALSEAA
jgi:signal transduction histidine kinase